ncbi:hypothetical protein AAVH_18794, partial [Aphelenchoides avenae]
MWEIKYPMLTCAEERTNGALRIGHNSRKYPYKWLCTNGDTNAQGFVLFAKGFVASSRSCSKGDAQRNLFDPSLSQSFKVTAGSVGAWYLFEYPYVG